YASADVPDRAGDVSARVDEHSLQAGKIFGLAMQQEQAGVRRDAMAHFVGELKSATALEFLFGEKDLDVAFACGLVGYGQAVVERADRFHVPPPFGGERSRAEFFTTQSCPHGCEASWRQMGGLSSGFVWGGFTSWHRHFGPLIFAASG